MRPFRWLGRMSPLRRSGCADRAAWDRVSPRRMPRDHHPLPRGTRRRWGGSGERVHRMEEEVGLMAEGGYLSWKMVRLWSERDKPLNSDGQTGSLLRGGRAGGDSLDGFRLFDGLLGSGLLGCGFGHGRDVVDVRGKGESSDC